jgi:hypothetical protein
MVPGFFSRGYSGRGVILTHSPPSSAEVKNEGCCISVPSTPPPPPCVLMTWTGTFPSLAFPEIIRKSPFFVEWERSKPCHAQKYVNILLCLFTCRRSCCVFSLGSKSTPIIPSGLPGQFVRQSPDVCLDRTRIKNNQLYLRKVKCSSPKICGIRQYKQSLCFSPAMLSKPLLTWLNVSSWLRS